MGVPMNYTITTKPSGFVEIKVPGFFGSEMRTVIPPDRSELRHIMISGSHEVRITHSLFGHWQQSHSHKGITEHYTVSQGWMVLVTLVPGEGLQLKVFEGTKDHPTRITVDTRLPHNVYYPKGAILSVAKQGEKVANPDRGNDDWWPHPELDVIIERLTFEHIQTIAGVTLEAEFPLPEFENELKRILEKLDADT